MNLLQTLIDSGDYTPSEAKQSMREARAEMNELLQDGELDEAENICQTYWGLEPDYIMDLIG
jgi:Spy/CpxP family protein refolding chaperone